MVFITFKSVVVNVDSIELKGLVESVSGVRRGGVKHTQEVALILQSKYSLCTIVQHNIHKQKHHSVVMFLFVCANHVLVV